MRTYPTNSAQSAARIVALTLVADGHVSPAELDVLERVDVYQQLGITRPEMQRVLQDFCEDLLQAHRSTWDDARDVDPRTIDQLFAEVDDPSLRMRVLRLCVGVAEADDRVADVESIVLVTAVENWGLHRQMLQEPNRREERQP